MCAPIPNEFITTLLSTTDRRDLSRLNRHLTGTILECACSEACISPANTLLYGSTICQDLALLYALGLTKEDIILLDETYNILWPWSLQYNAERLGNNKRLQYFPLLIVFPRSVREISFWIKFAQRYGLSPSIRSGGHNYEGFSCSNPLIIDTTDLTMKFRRGEEIIMKPYHISKEYVDVTTGVRLGPLYDALNKRGLIIAGGICPSVCVGGLVAGGGVGYFLRRFGYACDNLIEADIILASGKKVTCHSNNEYADLFRALKGAGGGNFGVITRYRLRTYNIKKVIFFTYSFAHTQMVSVLDALQRVGIEAPPALSGIVGNMIAGLGGIIVNGVYTPTHTEDPYPEFAAVINKYFFVLMPDVTPIDTTITYLPFIEVDTELGFEAPPLPFYKTRSAYTFELVSHSNLQKIVDSISIGPNGNGVMFCAVQFLVYGGYVNSVDPASSVMVARAGTKGWYQMALYYDDPNDLNSAFAYVNNIYNIIVPVTSIFADPNVPDYELMNPLYSYYGEHVEFLRAVKNKYDPNNIFTFPQSIPLAKISQNNNMSPINVSNGDDTKDSTRAKA